VCELKNREREMASISKSSTALIDYEPAKSAAASSTAIVVASEPVVKKRTFNDLIMAGEHTKVNAAAATSAASALRPLRC
jgi:hypothetical protein